MLVGTLAHWAIKSEESRGTLGRWTTVGIELFLLRWRSETG
jgi:hypothetical protein